MAIQVFSPKYDIDACLSEIRECFEVGWTGVGFKTVQFESDWKNYTGARNAYFLNSSTAGLNLACKIMKMKYEWFDDDEIITTPLTFISTNHAILKAGLKPVFADVDNTLCLSPKSVEQCISNRTKAVMYVGIGGNPGHLGEIKQICENHNLKLILDAAHMAGTRINGKPLGEEGDATIFSFQAVKNLPTGDSGMLCFKEDELDNIARKMGWLGIDKDTYLRSDNGGSYKWKYDVEYVGNKYHGNSIMAAIAIVQLKHLDEDNEYRRELIQQYKERLMKEGEKIKYVFIPEGVESSNHLFQIIVKDRDELLLFLNENNIFPGVHYVDNTEYRMYKYAQGLCPRASWYSNHVLSLPLHLRLKTKDVDRVCEVIHTFLVNHPGEFVIP